MCGLGRGRLRHNPRITLGYPFITLHNPKITLDHCFTSLPVYLQDPFLWSTHRGYHILTHNLHGAGGRTTHPVAWWVGYAFSLDFVHWRYSTVPAVTNTFTADDGTNVTLAGRERPQLLVDSDTGAPLALFSGAVPAAGQQQGFEGTYTLVQPTVALH